VTAAAGRVLILLALLVSCAGSVAGFAAGRRGSAAGWRLTRGLAYTFAGLMAAANLLMVRALLARDFSVGYVAHVGSRSIPDWVAAVSLWSSLEGSILFWGLVLGVYVTAATRANRARHPEYMPYAAAVWLACGAFFSFLLAGPAQPFLTVPNPPADGPGPNPLLQNHVLMMIHPPFLYLGYVGLTIPFAFAMGALLARRTDERWIVATRRWTLVAWTALGIGQLLGAHWAYQEVGWGGYYAWDPVENAALMPWLAATAFLHSVMVQEKKGMLKVWNMLLVILAFTLSLFGTFLTRSGVLNSIHSFTEGSIGPWFLGFIALTVAVSLAIVFWRLPQLRSPTKLESPVSREAAFLYNNLLLLALCLAILWGVVYPMVSEALRGEAVVLGRSYYDFFLRAFGLPLLLLMGIGPLIAWRRASLKSLATQFRAPTIVALVTGVVLVLLGAGSSIPGLVAYTFSAFVLATIVLEFARGTRARKALGATSWPTAFSSLISRNRRRYGGYVVHAAIVLFAIGVAGSSAFDSVAEAKLAKGESMRIGDYTLQYRSLDERAGANSTEIRATLGVKRGGRDLGTLQAGKNAYTIEQQVSNEVGIRSDRLTGEDLFVIAEQIDPDGSVYFRVFVKPLVNLIWLAGLVFLLGSVITLWPDRREQRRLVARTSEVGLPATR
jgi:cytochrome c-type biogenesis protein CcmF